MVWNHQTADCSFRKKIYCVIYYNFGHTFVLQSTSLNIISIIIITKDIYMVQVLRALSSIYIANCQDSCHFIWQIIQEKDVLWNTNTKSYTWHVIRSGTRILTEVVVHGRRLIRTYYTHLTCIWRPLWGWPRSNFGEMFGTKKLESMGYRVELYIGGKPIPFPWKIDRLGVKGSCVRLDCSYPQQQLPGGLPFQQATATVKCKTASKMVFFFNVDA